jgi:hypothetical protein
VRGVAQRGELENNIAWSGMDGFAFSGGMTYGGHNGAARTIAQLQTAAGFPPQLLSEPWVHAPGYLPGLGAPMRMPVHLGGSPPRTWSATVNGCGELMLTTDAEHSGETVTLTLAPRAVGYRLAGIEIIGTGIDQSTYDLSAQSITFTMPAGNDTLHITVAPEWDYFAVPPTGVPSITATLWAMFALIAIATASWGYITAIAVKKCCQNVQGGNRPVPV